MNEEPKEGDFVMNKLAKLSLLAATLSLPVGAFAAPWAIVATQFKDTEACKADLVDCRDGIYTIDLGPWVPKVYGPFLQDQLDPMEESEPPKDPPTYVKNDIFDMAVRPWSNEVLVSLFGSQEVLRLDVSNPWNPKLTGRLKMEYDTGMLDDSEQPKPLIYSLFAEDISITPDGKTAIVSDGGFSPYLAFIDLKQFQLKNIQNLEYDDPLNPGETISYYAEANAIAPNNKTVLFVDYFGAKIHYGQLNASRDAVNGIQTILSCSQPDPLSPLDPGECQGMLGRPVNVTISPPSLWGATAIVNLAGVSDPSWVEGSRQDGYVNVLKISPFGQVTPGTPFFVGGLPSDKTLTDNSSAGGNQSTAFAFSDKAYVLTQRSNADNPDPGNNPYPNILAELRVFAPGQVRVINSNFAELASLGTSQLFGVDTLAASPLTRFVIASNPTISQGANKLTLVDRLFGTKKTITLREDAIPVGVQIK